ncbi:MAG: nitroreductase family protein [Clostridiales bacterium]|nr:nitroreductase family protein [Clostridiales bacterium]
MKLYDAIYKRRSVRKFQMTPLEDGKIDKMKQFIQNVQPFTPNLMYEVEIVALPKEVKGYFIVKAPYYIVFSSEKHADAYKNAGYILEQIVLYLTARGIGTCYQGAAKIPEQLLKTPDSMESLMIVAFGNPKNEWKQVDTTQKRFPIKQLTHWETNPTDSYMKILEAASLAPSSFNSQPWRFAVEENQIHIFQKKNFLSSVQKLNEVDMGICMQHLMLAAEELWLNATIEKTTYFSGKVLKNCEYVATMKMEKN